MRVAGLPRLGLLAISLASTAHCGGAAVPELSRSLSERTVARLSQAPSVYAPGATGAASAETAAMRAAFEGALAAEARASMRHDPALDLVAAALAENFSDHGKRTSAPLAQWLLWRAGSVAIYRDHSGGWASSRGTNRESWLSAWTTRAAEHAPGGRTISYGLARFTAGKRTAEDVVIGSAPFEVTSFSKRYAPGGPLTLALRPRARYRELLFSIDLGDAVEEQTLTPAADGSFFLSRPVPSRPGRYFIEVQGPPPTRATLMMLPIYVGVPEPTEPDAFIQSPPPGPVDAAGWPAWLVGFYNAERARMGKPPLEVDARLSALASERSLLAAGRRELPRKDGALAARLQSMDVSRADFSETLTIARGADDVLLHLLRPSVRKRLVLRDRVLFGAAAAPRPTHENQPPRFSVVEETVIPAPPAPAPASPGPLQVAAPQEPVPRAPACSLDGAVRALGPTCVRLSPVRAEGTGPGYVVAPYGPPATAFDGDSCTPWNAGAHPPQSITADLGSPQRISALLLVPEMTPARAEVAHVVEVSDDGRSFRRAGEVRATMASGETVELPIPGGVVARYVRVATVASPSWVAWRDVVLVSCPLR